MSIYIYILFLQILSVENKGKLYKNTSSVYIWKKGFTFSNIGQKNDTTLGGRTLKIIVAPMYPYIMVDEKTQKLDGFIGEMWTILQGTYKFKNEITTVEYDDALELIGKGLGDVLLGSVVPPRKRISRVEVSQPYFYNWYHVFLKRPKIMRASSGLYLGAFSGELWLASILLFFLSASFLWLTLRTVRKFTHFNQASVSFVSCLIASCSGFLNQGYDLHVKCLSGRILVLFSVVFGFLLYAALNGVLVSQLANSRTQLPFESLEDVAVKKTHSLCVRTNSFVYNYFLDERGELLPKWRKILNGPGCLDMNNVSGLAEMLCNDKLAILENRIIMSSIAPRLTCELTALPQRLFEMHNYILYHKDFEGRKLISRGLKKMKSLGVMRRLEDKWFNIKSGNSARSVINKNPSGSATVPIVGLDHISGILIMMLVMIVLSTIIMFAEIAFVDINYKRNMQRKLGLS